MKTTVIHHSADFDGLFCREIARKFLPDAELIGWDFADKPLPIPEGQIYILDLPVDRVFGFDFNAPVGTEATQKLAIKSGLAADRTVWIDHHASSIASHPTDIPGYRIDGVAACRLAWQWFTYSKTKKFTSEFLAELPSKQDFIDCKVEEPLAVKLAGLYDVWTCGPDGKLLPDLQEFQHGLRSRPLTDEDWADLLALTPYRQMTTSEELLTNGRMIQGYANGVDAGTMKKSFLVDFEGLKFLALNTARCNSLTFAAKDVPETGHDALMGFFFNGEKWTVSLYHAQHRKDLDLSQIAIRHGGGGHRGACGFTSMTKDYPLPV